MTLTFDFTGTDPQLVSSLNMPTGGNARHPLSTVGLIYVLYTLDPTLILNSGSVRMLDADPADGTVVNCVFPAAVGMRSLLCNVDTDARSSARSRARCRIVSRPRRAAGSAS